MSTQQQAGDKARADAVEVPELAKATPVLLDDKALRAWRKYLRTLITPKVTAASARR